MSSEVPLLQIIFRTTLIVSTIAALFAVEFNSFNKAIVVKPVQTGSMSAVASPASELGLAAAKKILRTESQRAN